MDIVFIINIMNIFTKWTINHFYTSF